MQVKQKMLRGLFGRGSLLRCWVQDEGVFTEVWTCDAKQLIYCTHSHRSCEGGGSHRLCEKRGNLCYVRM